MLFSGEGRRGGGYKLMGKAMEPRLKITSGWLVRTEWTQTAVVTGSINLCSRRRRGPVRSSS